MGAQTGQSDWRYYERWLRLTEMTVVAVSGRDRDFLLGDRADSAQLYQSRAEGDRGGDGARSSIQVKWRQSG